MKTFAYIPARGGSTRIPRKNIRPLGGVPIMARVIDSLKGVALEGIGVSTDDDEIAGVATAAGATTLGPRAAHLTGDNAGFRELVNEDVSRYAEHFGVSTVLFVLATAGLVSTQHFTDALAAYEKRQPALLMAVTRYAISPFWALVPRDDGRGWRTLFPRESRQPSQRHPSTYVDAGLFFILDLERVRGVASLYEADPLDVFEVPQEIVVDVDTEEDWRELEARYERSAG